MAENSLEIRTKVRMAQWQSIIKECKESGMTVAEFCEERNISWHAYTIGCEKSGNTLRSPKPQKPSLYSCLRLWRYLHRPIRAQLPSILVELQLKLKAMSTEHP